MRASGEGQGSGVAHRRIPGHRSAVRDQLSFALMCNATAVRRVSVMLALPSAPTTIGAPVHDAGVEPDAGVKLNWATLQ